MGSQVAQRHGGDGGGAIPAGLRQAPSELQTRKNERERGRRAWELSCPALVPTTYYIYGYWRAGGAALDPPPSRGGSQRGRSALQAKWMALHLRVSLPLGEWALGGWCAWPNIAKMPPYRPHTP